MHLTFVAAWFCLLFLFKFISPMNNSLPTYFPALLGLVSITDIAIGSIRRARYLSDAADILHTEPENRTGLAKWRIANILSFAFAQTVSLFGFLLKLLGWNWNIAGIFFGVGLALLLWWTPRRIQAMPGSVR